MFLPEIYMHLQRIHSAPFDAPADPTDDGKPRRPPTSLESEAVGRDLSASPRRADEWDEWKSVRDVA